MNWLPLISRWRREAASRREQMDAGRGCQTVAWATEQAAIISTLVKCANQAEKSFLREKKRVTKAPEPLLVVPEGSKFGGTDR